MEIIALIIILSIMYAAKAYSISKQHDEIISDDVFMSWTKPNMC
jgi:hypothetical protein